MLDIKAREFVQYNVNELRIASSPMLLIMHPTSKKLTRHIGFVLSVHPFVKNRAC